MSKQRTEDVARALAEDVTNALGYELVDVEYLKEGESWFLRVFIDNDRGISHEDCQAVSERLSDLLDEKDPISQAYILEVSSPGIERPLKKPEDFVKYQGHKVRATTFKPLDGQREFVGTLEGIEEEHVVVTVKGKRVALPRETVAKVRLEVEF